MSIEKTLLMYTDLTPARYALLKDIQEGRSASMNGYVRSVLKDLLTEGCAINAHGANVLIFAAAIIEQRSQHEHYKYPVEQDLATMALRIRKNTRFRRIKTKHLRAMIDLYERPGLSYRWFAGVHGFDIVEDLIMWQLVSGASITGSRFTLSTSGKMLIEKEW